MKRALKKISIATLVLIAAFAVWFFGFRKEGIAALIIAEKPSTGYIAQSVTATGKIEPVDTVTVGTQVSGIIKNLYVDFNSKVRKGQLLAELDKSLLQATVDQYKGILQNAESQLVFAQNNFERQSLLFKVDAISKADYDLAVNTLGTSKAAVASAEAQVRQAETNLSYADIYSPIDGVILNRSISVGQTVASSFNTPTLFIIARDITKMEVEAAVDEADIGDVKAGNRSMFTVDAFINDQFYGTVTDVRLHPAVSANVVNYTTIINAPNDSMKLKPGMTANIVIYTKEVNNAMLIPAKALSFVPDSAIGKVYRVIGRQRTINLQKNERPGAKGETTTTFVWIVRGNKLIQKAITTGLNDNTHVEVLSGLTNDDLVATGINSGPVSSVLAAGGSPFLPKRVPGGGRTK